VQLVAQEQEPEPEQEVLVPELRRYLKEGMYGCPVELLQLAATQSLKWRCLRAGRWLPRA
jgi:hypothetical protein